jgi:hypothetical protein
MNDIKVGELTANMLAEDGNFIAYRPKLVKITGSVLSAILLQQMIRRFVYNGMKQFYKFREPCQHRAYHEGDSWTEELAFTEYEFDTALKHIGTKITKGVSKAEMLKKTDATGLVLYWIDANRVTWYSVNTRLLGILISPEYLVVGSNRNSFITDQTTDQTNTRRSRAEKKETPRRKYGEFEDVPDDQYIKA